jgi:hypothetical protein
LAEIDDPSAHDLANRRNWAALDDRGAMRVVQARRLPRRLAIDQAVRALRVEPSRERPAARRRRSSPPIFAASVRLAPS